MKNGRLSCSLCRSRRGQQIRSPAYLVLKKQFAFSFSTIDVNAAFEMNHNRLNGIQSDTNILTGTAPRIFWHYFCEDCRSIRNIRSVRFG